MLPPYKLRWQHNFKQSNYKFSIYRSSTMMTTTIKPKFSNYGFTLVELIVVILLIGILSISIAPRFFGVASYEDRRAVDELLTTIRHAQQMAMNRGGNIQIRINSGPNPNYIVSRTVAPINLHSPAGTFPYDKPLPNNIVIIPNPTIIVFDSLGRPVPNFQTIFDVGTQQIQIERETGYAHQI